MSRVTVSKLVLAVCAAFILFGAMPQAEARDCKWSGTPPLCEPTCPKGWKFQAKRPGGCLQGFQMLCCEPQGSTTQVQGVAPCHKQCSPLLGSVKPKSEASRVYSNCRALCDKKGTVTCPDGSKKSWKNPKC